MNYRDRIEKAVRQIFSPALKGTLTDIRVQHDHWCEIYHGNMCNCSPDITISTPLDQVFVVDMEGNASEKVGQ